MTSQKVSPSLHSSSSGAAQAELGALPEWNLSHLYPGMDSEAFRSDLAKAVDAQRRMIDLAVQRIETRIDRLDLEAAIETTLGEPSTNSPPSSASTPAR